jgi:hypothetical protein
MDDSINEETEDNPNPHQSCTDDNLDFRNGSSQKKMKH